MNDPFSPYLQVPFPVRSVPKAKLGRKLIVSVDRAADERREESHIVEIEQRAQALDLLPVGFHEEMNDPERKVRDADHPDHVARFRRAASLGEKPLKEGILEERQKGQYARDPGGRSRFSQRIIGSNAPNKAESDEVSDAGERDEKRQIRQAKLGDGQEHQR